MEGDGETKMKTRRQTWPAQLETDSQREGVERRVEQRTPNVIRHSSHGVQGRKKREKGEQRHREGGIGGREERGG